MFSKVGIVFKSDMVVCSEVKLGDFPLIYYRNEIDLRKIEDPERRFWQRLPNASRINKYLKSRRILRPLTDFTKRTYPILAQRALNIVNYNSARS